MYSGHRVLGPFWINSCVVVFLAGHLPFHHLPSNSGVFRSIAYTTCTNINYFEAQLNLHCPHHQRSSSQSYSLQIFADLPLPADMTALLVLLTSRGCREITFDSAVINVYTHTRNKSVVRPQLDPPIPLYTCDR